MSAGPSPYVAGQDMCDLLSYFLTSLFNKSLDTGVFPDGIQAGSRPTTSEEKRARRQRAEEFPAGVQLVIYLKVKAAGEDCSDTYPVIIPQQWTDA